ncbi:MAG: hypothetical protein IPN29_10095 [Saprospiraceae bacterium]|nr:hypothetical protein [Saprospiraceae bacterium]
MKEEYIELIRHATSLIEKAKAESNRAEEDAVAQQIEAYALAAIKYLFKAFLIQNGFEPKDGLSLNAYYSDCLLIDDRFQSVNPDDISAIELAKTNLVYTSIGEANKTLELATHIQAVVTSESPFH